MKTLPFALLALAIGPAAAQMGPGCPVYATDSSSLAWVARVRQLPRQQQIEALRQRVACGARVRNMHQTGVCVMLLSGEQRRAYEEKCRLADAADPRPRAAVLLYLLNDRFVGPNALGNLPLRVSEKTVKKVEFVVGTAATAIYGSRGAAGVVRVTTR